MYFHVYGRNRYSKRLFLYSRNHRTKKEAQEEVKRAREGSGHDNTFRISTTHFPIT